MTFKELLSKHKINSSEVNQSGDITIVHKENWNYGDALEFQNDANSYVYNNPHHSIFILTSHPAVLTMGRGLQRDMIEKHKLVEFDSKLENDLPVEVYKVKRGGGLTFHHSGQIVLYPIVHIGHHKIKTLKLINNIFEIVKQSIEELTELRGIDYHRDLLGLWYNEHKLASMGIQLKKFVSMHGLALNVIPDEKMSQVLKTVFPCGIDGNNYRCLSQLQEIDKGQLVTKVTKQLMDKKALV
jgi:lipoyl(octanoyl) transferase